jgi:formate-dependent nitrite reductase membrane component NrfD
VKRQQEIDSMLRWGIVFSLLWLAGIGSFIAVRAGFKARRAISFSNGSLRGSGRAWVCLILGGLGLAIWVPMFLIGVLNNIIR